jgi:hypothetical protein
VILLENSNEWNLSPAKEGSSKKRERKKGKEKEKRSKDLKAKEVKPHMKKLHVSKGEKRGWNLQAAGRDSIERKKGDHIFL